MKNTRIEIFNNARNLFIEKGFKDTNISEITKLVGIGVGTFYNFFNSKEQLFMEIFFKENMDLKQKIVSNINFDDDPVKVFKEVINKLLYGMNTNPILKEWYNKDVINKLEKIVDVNELTKEFDDFSFNLFIGIIEKYKEKGKIRQDLSNDLILSLFNSLSYVELHKADIGLQYFPEVIDYLVEFITKGLMIYNNQ